MNWLLPPALAFFALSGTVALAQSAPSVQERMACRSDATRLCASFIGKPEQMNTCLRDNKAKLSESCRKVVEARGG